MLQNKTQTPDKQIRSQIQSTLIFTPEITRRHYMRQTSHNKL